MNQGTSVKQPSTTTNSTQVIFCGDLDDDVSNNNEQKYDKERRRQFDVDTAKVYERMAEQDGFKVSIDQWLTLSEEQVLELNMSLMNQLEDMENPQRVVAVENLPRVMQEQEKSSIVAVRSEGEALAKAKEDMFQIIYNAPKYLDERADMRELIENYGDLTQAMDSILQQLQPAISSELDRLFHDVLAQFSFRVAVLSNAQNASGKNRVILQGLLKELMNHRDLIKQSREHLESMQLEVKQAQDQLKFLHEQVQARNKMLRHMTMSYQRELNQNKYQVLATVQQHATDDVADPFMATIQQHTQETLSKEQEKYSEQIVKIRQDFFKQKKEMATVHKREIQMLKKQLLKARHGKPTTYDNDSRQASPRIFGRKQHDDDSEYSFMQSKQTQTDYELDMRNLKLQHDKEKEQEKLLQSILLPQEEKRKFKKKILQLKENVDNCKQTIREEHEKYEQALQDLQELHRDYNLAQMKQQQAMETMSIKDLAFDRLSRDMSSIVEQLNKKTEQYNQLVYITKMTQKKTNIPIDNTDNQETEKQAISLQHQKPQPQPQPQRDNVQQREEEPKNDIPDTVSMIQDTHKVDKHEPTPSLNISISSDAEVPTLHIPKHDLTLTVPSSAEHRLLSTSNDPSIMPESAYQSARESLHSNEQIDDLSVQNTNVPRTDAHMLEENQRLRREIELLKHIIHDSKQKHATTDYDMENSQRTNSLNTTSNSTTFKSTTKSLFQDTIKNKLRTSSSDYSPTRTAYPSRTPEPATPKRDALHLPRRSASVMDRQSPVHHNHPHRKSSSPLIERLLMHPPEPIHVPTVIEPSDYLGVGSQSEESDSDDADIEQPQPNVPKLNHLEQLPRQVDEHITSDENNHSPSDNESKDDFSHYLSQMHTNVPHLPVEKLVKKKGIKWKVIELNGTQAPKVADLLHDDESIPEEWQQQQQHEEDMSSITTPMSPRHDLLKKPVPLASQQQPNMLDSDEHKAILNLVYKKYPKHSFKSTNQFMKKIAHDQVRKNLLLQQEAKRTAAKEMQKQRAERTAEEFEKLASATTIIPLRGVKKKDQVNSTNSTVVPSAVTI